jgi:hypothetical protein
MRKIDRVFTENIGSLFSLWYQSNKNSNEFDKKKKNGYTIPTLIFFTSQSSKFYAFKAHLYHLSLMGNTGTISPHEGEIISSKEDGKILKSDLAAWTCTEKLVKAWITATFDAFKTKIGFWVQLTPSLTRSNRAHKKLD